MKDHLFISDLDGTLLSLDQTIHQDCLLFIKNHIKNGGLFSIATARSLNSAIDYVNKLEIQIPVILFNGAQVYCPLNQEYLYTLDIELSVMRDLIKAMSAFDLNPFVHAIEEDNQLHVYFQNISNIGEVEYLNSRFSCGDSRFRAHLDCTQLTDISCIEVLTIGTKDQIHDYLSAIKPLLNDNLRAYIAQDIYGAGYYWLEVAHVNATKSAGMEFIKQHTNANTTICFGDNHNDHCMIDKADIGIAVNNAVDEIKSVADTILEEAHHERAVTQFMETYLKQLQQDNEG